MSERKERFMRRQVVLSGLVILCLALLVGVSVPLCQTHERGKKVVDGVALPEGGIPVIVENSGAVDYQAEPVTLGTPLPREAKIVSTEQLSLNLAGTVVPSQMRVLSRWGRRDDPKAPIRWLLLDFQADVPAKKSVTYHLAPTARPQPPLKGIVTKETQRGVEVTTGALSFFISKDGFSLLRQVKVNGVEIGGDTQAGGIAIENNGTVYRSANDRPEVVIEETGPLRTVIRVRGKFRDKQGKLLVGGDARMYQEKIAPNPENFPLTYTYRVTAYQGKNFLKTEYCLENNGNSLATYYPVNDLFIDGNVIQFPFGGIGPVTVLGGGFTAPVGAGGQFLLHQNYVNRDIKGLDGLNFSYQATLDDRVIATGKRYPGCVDVTGKKGGVTISIPRFWQNAPKSVGWRDGILSVGILPKEHAVKEVTGPFSHYTQGNYYFSGGWHKTTELFFTFHGPELGERYADRVQARLDTPLLARCEPGWYSKTRAFGLTSPRDEHSQSRSEVNEARDIYERYQEMFIDGKFDNKGRDIMMLRETRTMNLGYYGWENFGDMAFNGAFSSLHYDWPYIMWLQYTRSGDPRYRERAVEMTEHSVDLDQIHTDSPGRRSDGIWQWENCGGNFVNNHHKSTSAAGWAMSHTWNGGYALGYLLTGNPRYREAAELSAEAGHRRWQKAIEGQKVTENQTRTQGWSILMLVNLYRISGDPKLLQDALAIFRNSLLYTEQLPTSPGSGGRGYISSTGKEYAGKVVITMATYPLEPLCDLHLEASSAGLKVDDLEAYLFRSLKWLKGHAYVGGKTDSSGKYSLLTLSYATDPLIPGNNPGGELAHNVQVAGAFAYASRILRDRDSRQADEYMDFARQLFRDLMFYRNEQRRVPLESSLRSPVGWGWLPTASKEIGYIGRGGQAYLFAEDELARKTKGSSAEKP